MQTSTENVALVPSIWIDPYLKRCSGRGHFVSISPAPGNPRSSSESTVRSERDLDLPICLSMPACLLPSQLLRNKTQYDHIICIWLALVALRHSPPPPPPRSAPPSYPPPPPHPNTHTPSPNDSSCSKPMT